MDERTAGLLFLAAVIVWFIPGTRWRIKVALEVLVGVFVVAALINPDILDVMS